MIMSVIIKLYILLKIHRYQYWYFPRVITQLYLDIFHSAYKPLLTNKTKTIADFISNNINIFRELLSNNTDFFRVKQ